MFYLIAALLATFSYQAHAFSFQEIDNRLHFAPLRHQGNTKHCWAYTAASLMEEHFCLNDQSLCNKTVSIVDVSRHQNIVAFNKSGQVVVALQNAIQGVCLEENAPFFFNFGIGCMWNNPSHPEECARDKVLAAFSETRNHLSDIPYLKKHGGRIVNQVNKYLPNTLKDRERVIAALFESTTPDQFITSLFLTHQCKKNRIQTIKKSIIYSYDVSRYSNYNKFKMIYDVLSKNRSVAIILKTTPNGTVCLSENCGMYAHAMIIDGIRNKGESQEFHLRNSYGDEYEMLGAIVGSDDLSVVSNWKKTNDLLPSIIQLVWLENSN